MNNLLGLSLMNVFRIYLKPIWNSQYFVWFVFIETDTHKERKEEKKKGFQDVEPPKFQENRHMNLLRLSALHTGRLYPPGNIPVTHFC